MANIFMKHPAIKGNATTQGFENSIVLQSVNFGSDRSVNTQLGNANNRSVSSPRFSEVTVTKVLDNASNRLFKAACAGETIAQLEIHVCTNTKETAPIAKYVLSDVVISEHSHSIYDGGLPHETLSLNYVRLEMSYLNRDKTGKQVGSQTMSADLSTGVFG